MKPGLERISRLLEMMADPQRGYPSIHVTGSNGKTSTAWITSALLVAHGLKVGTFTSPHLERVEERIAIDGRSLTEEGFASALVDVVPFVDLLEQETGERPSYFEVLTAAGFAAFAERAVDVAVVEVGMGGRLDSTNVLESRVAVLVGVSLEHTRVLGETVAEITGEKVAIAKPGGLLVSGPLPEEAEQVVRRHVEELAIPWRRYGRDFELAEATRAVGGWLCEVSGIYQTYRELPLLMHGRHQTRNLAVALAACEELLGGPLSEEATGSGVAAARSLGRLEVLARHPLVLVDGAHTPEAFAVLADSLGEEFPSHRWVLVLGCLSDKPLEEMLPRLRGRVAEVFATAPASERARPPAEVAQVARRAFGPEVSVHEVPTPAEALGGARAAAGPEGAVLVTGSLYLAGEVRSMLGERLPATATITPSPDRPNGDGAGLEPARR